MEQNETLIFIKTEEQKVASITYNVVKKLSPQTLPTIEYLKKPEIVASIIKDVEEKYIPYQPESKDLVEKPDVNTVVTKTIELI